MPLLLALRFWEQTLTDVASDGERVVRAPRHVMGDRSRAAFVTELYRVRLLGGTRQRTAVIVLKAHALGRLAGADPLERDQFVTERFGAAHALALTAHSASRVTGAVRSAPRMLSDVPVRRDAFATTQRRTRATFTLTRQAVIVDG